jgi:DnaK suppressor protein
MKKSLLQKLKQKLEKEKAIIEKELKKIAKRDEKLPDDWDTIFPKFDSGESGLSLEEAADEVEEYETLLPIEYTLETELRDINLALEKIKKGRYGKCEKCQKEIPLDRLKASPEARFCLKCQKLEVGS